MLPRHRLPLLILTALGMLAAATAGAAGKPKHVKYVPPAGFAGHAWGDPRSSFEQLPAEPLGVGAAYMNPVVTEQRYTCTGACSIGDVLRSLYEKREGGGMYVLSEYTREGQGFQYGTDDRVQFYPVVYQFCANWDSTKKVRPENFDEINQFCGVKMLFESESRQTLRTLPAGYETKYDLVLKKLIARFGRPSGLMLRGEVVIETMEGETAQAPERKFRVYRWCPAYDRRLHTGCAASVTLSLNPEDGTGTVLYSTPVLWEFAYARQHNGFKGDSLFRTLHARK